MASFSFDIPADYIAAGVPAAIETVRFDKNSNRTVTPSLLSASFGDGYEQRAIDGLNPKKEKFNLNYQRRPKDEINLIAAFLDKNSAKSIDLTIETITGPEIVKVMCEQYDLRYDYEEYHSLRATFRRVYEP